eukprot:CAMPEP_0195516684 /NCGR_PEP_ID=MMETSP0794_2-20130614/8279_1 /TAXON_ID=515487 /ORGANISM="Stephanopyxis turris, Strain CCMP 815" /LENGTH=142 /DNA_ID=CAMNT_0040645337 /DNA_START=258 /DNA_END=687 /DNA_ORIENTATION=+
MDARRGAANDKYMRACASPQQGLEDKMMDVFSELNTLCSAAGPGADCRSFLQLLGAGVGIKTDGGTGRRPDSDPQVLNDLPSSATSRRNPRKRIIALHRSVPESLQQWGILDNTNSPTRKISRTDEDDLGLPSVGLSTSTVA